MGERKSRSFCCTNWRPTLSPDLVWGDSGIRAMPATSVGAATSPPSALSCNLRSETQVSSLHQLEAALVSGLGLGRQRNSGNAGNIGRCSHIATLRPELQSGQVLRSHVRHVHDEHALVGEKRKDYHKRENGSPTHIQDSQPRHYLIQVGISLFAPGIL